MISEETRLTQKLAQLEKKLSECIQEYNDYSMSTIDSDYVSLSDLRYRLEQHERETKELQRQIDECTADIAKLV